MVKKKRKKMWRGRTVRGEWIKDVRIFWVAERRRRGCCEMATVNISIAKSCQFRGVWRKRGGVANKSGGCAFPGRGKYLNRRALTRERGGEGRRGGDKTWIRTCSIKIYKCKSKIFFSFFRSYDSVSSIYFRWNEIDAIVHRYYILLYKSWERYFIANVNFERSMGFEE